MGEKERTEGEAMVRENDLVAIFQSIHRVMKAEKALKLGGADVLLIPVPRQLTSDCGLAIRFRVEERTRVEEILAREGIAIAELHLREGAGYSRL